MLPCPPTINKMQHWSNRSCSLHPSLDTFSSRQTCQEIPSIACCSFLRASVFCWCCSNLEMKDRYWIEGVSPLLTIHRSIEDQSELKMLNMQLWIQPFVTLFSFGFLCFSCWGNLSLDACPDPRSCVSVSWPDNDRKEWDELNYTPHTLLRPYLITISQRDESDGGEVVRMRPRCPLCSPLATWSVVVEWRSTTRNSLIMTRFNRMFIFIFRPNVEWLLFFGMRLELDWGWAKTKSSQAKQHHRIAAEKQKRNRNKVQVQCSVAHLRTIPLPRLLLIYWNAIRGNLWQIIVA